MRSKQQIQVPAECKMQIASASRNSKFISTIQLIFTTETRRHGEKAFRVSSFSKPTSAAWPGQRNRLHQASPKLETLFYPHSCSSPCLRASVVKWAFAFRASRKD